MDLQSGLRRSEVCLACALPRTTCSRKNAQGNKCSLLIQKSLPVKYVSSHQSHMTSRRRSKFHTARASSSNSEISEDRRDPEDVRGAIAIGLGLYEQGKYQEALEIFEKGLELPGSGMKRFRCP